MTVDEMKHFNLIVIGGGSAGMAAAISSAQNGLKVLLFDASGPDFDKPCGEGLMPPAISALTELGVDISDSCSLSGIKYITESRKTAVAEFSKKSVAFGIRRRELRKAMWGRAVEVGVEIRQTRVEAVSVSQNAVLVNGFTADYLCIASGANNRVLSQLGLEDKRKRSDKPMRIGLRRHVKITPWSSWVEVYWRDRCELYITPVSKDCVNIAVLSWDALSFDVALDLFPEVKEQIAQAEWDDVVAGRGPLSHHCSSIQKGRVFVAGDAAMFIDAMTGEGNTLAIKSGMAVSKAIKWGRPFTYRLLWLGVVWRYWVVTAPVVWISQFVTMRKMLLEWVIRLPILLKIGVRFLSAGSSKPSVSDFRGGVR